MRFHLCTLILRLLTRMREYDYNTISDKWYLFLRNAARDHDIQAFLRWKNVPELELKPN